MDSYERDDAIRELTDQRGHRVARDDVEDYLEEHLFRDDWDTQDVDDIIDAVRNGGQR